MQQEGEPRRDDHRSPFSIQIHDLMLSGIELRYLISIADAVGGTVYLLREVLGTSNLCDIAGLKVSMLDRIVARHIHGV